jgi:hypothetical protein
MSIMGFLKLGNGSLNRPIEIRKFLLQTRNQQCVLAHSSTPCSITP